MKIVYPLMKSSRFYAVITLMTIAAVIAIAGWWTQIHIIAIRIAKRARRFGVLLVLVRKLKAKLVPGVFSER